MEYTLIFLLILFGAYYYDIRGETRGKEAYLIGIFILLTFLSGFRYRVGGDSIYYESYFEDYPTLRHYFSSISAYMDLGFQPLWMFINAIVKSCGGDVYDFQLLHAAVLNFSIYSFIKQRTQYALTFLSIFTAFLLYFYYSFEIQREALAIAVFLFNIKNLEEGNWKKYYLLSFLSFLFHVSAIVLFVFPLFRLVKLNSKVIILIVALGLPLTLFKTTLIDLIQPLLFLEGMREKAAIYFKMDFSLRGLLSFYMVRVVVPLAPLLLLNKKIGNSKNGFILAFLIFSISSHILIGTERFLNYVYIWYIVELINLWYGGEMDLKKWWLTAAVKFSFLCSLFFVIAYKGFVKTEGEYGYFSIYFPYKNKFEKIRSAEREIYIEELWKNYEKELQEKNTDVD